MCAWYTYVMGYMAGGVCIYLGMFLQYLCLRPCLILSLVYTCLYLHFDSLLNFYKFEFTSWDIKVDFDFDLQFGYNVTTAVVPVFHCVPKSPCLAL